MFGVVRLRTVSDYRRLEKIVLIVQWKAATQAELIWYSEKNLKILFNKFFPKSELMKGKGTYLSLSNLRQHKWNYMISKGELRFPNSSCEVMESPFRNHKMYTAGSEKFGWPTHIINSANKPNYMVLTFPPPPPRFPTDAALQFFRNTPLYSFGNN